MELKELLGDDMRFSRKIILTENPERAKRDILKCNSAGIPAVNYEIYTVAALAEVIVKDALTAAGKPFRKISSIAAAALMMKILQDKQKELEYFNKPGFMDLATADAIIRDLNIVRAEGCADKLQGSDKLADLKILCDEYTRRLEGADEYYDPVRMMLGAPLLAGNEYSDTLFAVYADTQLSGAERNLIQALAGEKPIYISVPSVEGIEMPKRAAAKDEHTGASGLGSLYGQQTEKIEKPSVNFFRSYGLHNEIRGVVKDIMCSGIPWEQVQIVSCSPDDFNSTADFLEKLNIPFCMPEGVSGKYSPLYSLLEAFRRLVAGGYEAEDLKSIIRNPILKVKVTEKTQTAEDVPFDTETVVTSETDEDGNEKKEEAEIRYISRNRLCRCLDKSGIQFGRSRIADYCGKDDNADKADGYLRQFLKDILECIPEDSGTVSMSGFCKGLADFIIKYAVKGNKDSFISAGELRNQSRYIELCGTLEQAIDMAESIVEKAGFRKSENDENGRVYIASIFSTAAIFRPYVFLTGFDGKSFPGKDNESPVLLDREREDLGLEGYKTADSTRNNLYRLLSLLSAEMTELSVSYVYYDTVNLREQNPSSFYNLLLANQNLKPEDTAEVGFIENDETRLTDKSEYYLWQNNKETEVNSKTAGNNESGSASERHGSAVSATMMEEFLACPKKYYFHRIACIAEPKQEKSRMNWLDPSEKGLLVHRIMEKYIHEHMIAGTDGQVFSDDIYKKVFDECAAWALEKYPYHIEDAYIKEIKKIREACENELKHVCEDFSNGIIPVETEFGFGNNEDNEEEQKFSIGGKDLCGSIDRVDRMQNGSYRIVDYKSGSEEHKEHDLNAGQLIQPILYAQFYTKLKNVQISSIIYRFPFEDKNELAMHDPESDEAGERERVLSDLLKRMDSETAAKKYRKIFFESPGDPDNTALKYAKGNTTCIYCGYAKLCDRAGKIAASYKKADAGVADTDDKE